MNGPGVTTRNFTAGSHTLTPAILISRVRGCRSNDPSFMGLSFII